MRNGLWRKGLVGAAAGLLLAAQGALADQESGFSVSAGAGYAYMNDPCQTISTFSGGLPANCDRNDVSWRVFGGYRFNRYFGVELGYVQFPTTTATLTPSGTGKYKLSGMPMYLTGSYPVSNRFAVVGKFGMIRYLSDVNATGAGGTSSNGLSATYDIGLQYNITPSLGLRLDWTYYYPMGKESDGGTVKVQETSINVQYNF